METVAADREGLAEAVRRLRQGGLVIVPTETFYGIACDARSSPAVGRLVALKGRPYGKPVPLVAGSTEMVRSSIPAEPPLMERLAQRFWPGPLTLILPAGPHFPQGITGGTGTIGIRVPGPSFALDLVMAMGRPLTATSANLAGQRSAEAAEDLDPALFEEVDLLVDGGRTPGGEPSTVLDITTIPPRMVREGALAAEVRRFLAEKRGHS